MVIDTLEGSLVERWVIRAKIINSELIWDMLAIRELWVGSKLYKTNLSGHD